MKLTINPKELLALHNLLHEKFTYHGDKFFQDGDPRAPDDDQLKQVYGRIRACVISSLSNKLVDPVDDWFEREQAKIDYLRDQNVDVENQKVELAKLADVRAGELRLDTTCDDVAQDEQFVYPRQGPKGPRQGKHHGKR